MSQQTPEARLAEMEAECREIVGAGQEFLHWQEDDRFQAVVSVFKREKAEQVLAIVEKAFLTKWTYADLKKAPARVKEIAKSLGGLRAGQMLFSSDPDCAPILFAAWWPWGNNNYISIRIGYWAEGLSETAQETVTGEFKSWFGVVGQAPA